MRASLRKTSFVSDRERAALKAELRSELHASLKQQIVQELSSQPSSSSCQHVCEETPPGDQHTAAAEEKAAAELETFDESINSREMQGSMWDVLLFVGASCFSRVDSAVLALLLLINVAVQSLFIYGLLNPDLKLTEPKINHHTIELLRTWRETSAHDYRYYNAATKQTLVSRVCAKDGSLNEGASQVSAISDLDGYLGADFDGSGVSTGSLMCMIAVLIWLLTIEREINTTLALVRGVFGIPRGSTKITTRPLTVHTLGFGRRWAMIFVQSWRLAIAALMLYYGSLYIIYTSSVENLLLNAVALEIVISVDEIVFEALSPRQVKKMVSNANGLPLSSVRLQSCDVGAACTLAVAASLLAYFTANYIIPQQNEFLAAKDAICAGDRDFVTLVDGAGVMVWSYPGGVDTASLNIRNYPHGAHYRQAEADMEAERTPTRLTTPLLTKESVSLGVRCTSTHSALTSVPCTCRCSCDSTAATTFARNGVESTSATSPPPVNSRGR